MGWFRPNVARSWPRRGRRGTRVAAVAAILAIATCAYPGGTRAGVDGVGVARDRASTQVSRQAPRNASPHLEKAAGSSATGLAQLEATIPRGTNEALVAWRQDSSELIIGDPWLKTLRIWDARTWRQTGTLDGPDGPIVAIEYSRDGRQLASASALQADSAPPALVLWDIASRTVAKRVVLPEIPLRLIRALAFGSDDQHVVVAIGYAGRSAVYDLVRGVLKAELQTPFNLGPMQVDPSGQRLAYASSDSREGFPLKLLSLADGSTTVGELRHGDASLTLAFSPTGQQIAVGDADGGVSVYDARSGRVSRRLRAHGSEVRAVRYLLQGDRLATAGHDGVRVWEVRTGIQLVHCQPADPRAYALSLSPDGEHLITAGLTELKVWKVCAAPSGLGR